MRAVRELSQAFALAVPHAEALRIRDDVAFLQAVLAKRAPGEARPEEELDHAVRQIISRAIAPEGVVDIFAASGLSKPDISILADEFLEHRSAPSGTASCGQVPTGRSALLLFLEIEHIIPAEQRRAADGPLADGSK